jgi:type I restriction enzyme S subunit
LIDIKVPPLRFPEFKGEWALTSLSELCGSFEYGLNEPAVSFDGLHKYLRITDIDESTSAFKDDGITSPAGFDDLYKMKENDIVFTRTGASVGKTYLYDKKDGCLYYAGFLIRANIRKGNPYFVFSETKRNKFNNWVKLMSARSGQPGINSKEYASYSFFAPSQEEQDKISLVFKLVDQRINVQRKIIDDFLRLKKSLIDSFFNSADCPLSSMIEEYSERANQSYNNYEVYSVSNSEGFIKQTDQFGGKEIASLNKSNYKIVGKSMFAYNPARINVGSIARNEENNPVIVSPMYVVFAPKQSISPEYLECFFKSSFFSKQMKSRLEGSVRQCLTFDGLSSIPIKKFSTNEQEDFVNLVCKLKNVEQIESQILEKFKEGKNYLLNSLFI